MLTPEEQEEQQLLWKEFLDDFESVFPVFAERGITKNVALQVFTTYGGTAPLYIDSSEDEGESWKKR